MSHHEPSVDFVSRQRVLADLSICHIRINGEIDVPVHSHDVQHVRVIATGAMAERGSGRAAECGAGSIRLSPADDLHNMRVVDGPFECVVISLLKRSRSSFPSRRTYCGLPAPSSLAGALTEQLTNENPSAALALYQDAAEFVAQAKLMARFGEASPVPDWLSELRQLLDVSFMRPPSLSVLARQVGVHPAHLSRAFHQHFGRPLSSYIRERRLGAALDLLSSTGETISVVAAEAGFADHAHLTRVTRSYLGVTPSGIRHRAQRGTSPSFRAA